MQRRLPDSGFTLIETMVAITILMIAIIAPMAMTVQALNSAYYARDQITASNLAQEAIETVRAVRDGNVLSNAFGTSVNLLNGIPNTDGTPFTVDTTNNQMVSCSGTCPPLQTNGQLFGYQSGWETSRYTRSVTAQFVNGNPDEVKITVTVTWQTGRLQARSFTISENLYRWVEDGAATS